MTRKRRKGVPKYIAAGPTCRQGMVPLVGAEKRIPEWKPVGRRGGIERHVCPRCQRERRAA